MAKHKFDDMDLYRARRLRAMGTSWDDLGRRFGCDPETIRRQIDPEYRKVRSDRYRPEGSPYHVLNRDGRVSGAEAARALARVPIDSRTRVARWLGDPLPGRSALDRKKADKSSLSCGQVVDAGTRTHSMEDHLLNGRVV
jgi:hypothetical protein